MSEIFRMPPNPVAITANSSAASTSGSIAYGQFAGGGIMIAATGGATQIAWHGVVNPGGTPRPVNLQGTSTGATTPVVVGYNPIPDECFALPFVVPVIAGGTTMAATFVGKG